jgi:hypothetical protein
MIFVWKLKIVALFCLLLASTSCGSPSTSNSNTAGSANPAGGGSAPAATATNENAVDFITKAMRAQLDAKSYRARMESTFAGQNTARVVEFVAPDRFRMTSDTDEIIVVGPESYRRAKGGQWQKFPANIGSMVNAFRDPKMIDELTKNAQVKFLGPEVLDGTPTLVYEYTLANAFGTNMTSTSKTWIGASDSLPRKSETEAEINKQKSKTVITFYDYNASINIEPPI